jgi:predicted membrane channel-forming protein YqfA (hemolysin III family)
MKRKLIFVFLIFVFLGFMVLFVFNRIIKKTADWKYIQQAGGIKTGTPLKTEDGIYLPIIALRSSVMAYGREFLIL